MCAGIPQIANHFSSDPHPHPAKDARKNDEAYPESTPKIFTF